VRRNASTAAQSWKIRVVGTKVPSIAFWTATCATLEKSWEFLETARRFVIIPDAARKAPPTRSGRLLGYWASGW